MANSCEPRATVARQGRRVRRVILSSAPHLARRKDDGNITALGTSASASSLTADTWYTAKVVVDDDPQNAALQRLGWDGHRARQRVDTDNDGDWSDETTLLNSTAVDDDWSAGYVGLYKGAGDSTVHQFDDVKLGFDNNGDGDILDAGDDVLVDDDFNSNQISLSYDNNGNLTADGVYNYEYDAWNRLRKAQLVVGSDTITIGEYEYYGDTRRSKKVVSNHGPEVVENDGGNTTVVFYYDGRWRIVETRNGSNQTTFQHLWGTQYTDELIWIEKNGDPTESNDTNPDDQSGESTADERYFVHQDRNWNVVALTEYDTGGTNNGRIAERYSYTPYGSFVVLKGDSGSGELCSVKLTSTVGNLFAHQGLFGDAELSGYQNRNRWLSLAHERYAQRDPAGYSDGLGLYTYVQSHPNNSVDPNGLKRCSGWVSSGPGTPTVVGATRISGGNGVSCRWKCCRTWTRACYAAWRLWWCGYTETCTRCGPTANTQMPTPPVGGPTGMSLTTYCASFGVVNGDVVPMPGGQPPPLTCPSAPTGDCPDS